MIYDFTIEEEIRINELINDTKLNIHRDYSDATKENALGFHKESQIKTIRWNFGEENQENKEDKTELWKNQNNILNEMLNDIEAKRFEQLDTPSKIMSDAKNVINNAILYEYTYIIGAKLYNPKAEYISISQAYIDSYYILLLADWRYKQYYYKTFREIKKPLKIRFLKSGMKNYLEQIAIPKHIAALEGTPQEAELRQLINDCLDNSKFIIDDKKVTLIEAVEKPFITENSIASRKIIENSKYMVMNSLISSQMVSKAPTKISKKDIPGQYTIQWDFCEKDVVYIATTDIVNDSNININAKIDAYDMAIINAIGSLYISHQIQDTNEPCYLTPMDIWRFMNGKKANEKIKITPNQEKQLIQHIDKLRFTKFEIDLKSQMEKWGISFDERYAQKTGKADDAILNLTGMQIYTSKNKNQTTYGYRVNTEPILFTYSRYRKQIITVDKNLLNVTDNKSLGENTIVFKNYLLKRIENYKHGYLNSNIIKLETIYRETGIKEPGQRENEEGHTSKAAYLSAIRKERAKDCKEIERILTTWKTAKYIKSFRKEGQGNEVYYIFEIDKHSRRIKG